MPETVFVLDPGDGARAANAGSEVVTVSERVMDKLATTQHPRGPVAVLETPDPAVEPVGPALLLWGVGDPGNLGTALRSAAAFGVSTVLGPGCADLWNPKVLRAAAGAHFRGVIVQHRNVTGVVETWGRALVAAVPRGGVAPSEVEPLASLVAIGAEGPGLPSEVVAIASSTVTIPMPGGVESLNAGVAASILAYELGRRNAGIGQKADD